MKRAEWERRVAEVLADERTQPVSRWYLSFADERGFLGAAIVQAQGITTATMRAHRLGINPGGQVAAYEVPSEVEIQPGMMDRLLNREEAESLGRVQ